MLRLFTTVLLSLILAVPAVAADWTWSKEDTAREVLGLGLTVIDWGQTNDIRNHDGMIELNPILGRTPDQEAIRDYFVGVLVLHPLISAALPARADLFGYELKPRTAWQYFYIGVEATATISNYNGGLRLKY